MKTITFDVREGKAIIDNKKLDKRKLIEYLNDIDKTDADSFSNYHNESNIIFASFSKEVEKSGIPMKLDFSADVANGWVTMEFYKFISADQLSVIKSNEEKQSYILKICDTWASVFAEEYRQQWFSKKTTTTGYIFQYFWGEISLVARIFPDGNGAAKVIFRLEENLI